MSLILDALRKSEAERRRGQAPDLHSPAPLLVRRTTPSRSPWPFLIGAFAVVALAVAAWWWSMRAMPPAATDISDRTLTDGVENVAPMPAAAPAPVPDAAQVAAASRPSPASVPAPAVTPPVAIALPPAPAPTVLPTATARPVLVQTPVAAVEQALPSLAALSTTQRAALPPLKMSMHVWADAPADRFAIVDGQRVGEGARLSGAVVAQIRSDGLVLDINGQLYLLPRP